MADLEDGGKDHFVCLGTEALLSPRESTLTLSRSIEPTVVDEMISLQPGETWEASAEMKVLSSKLYLIA